MIADSLPEQLPNCADAKTAFDADGPLDQAPTYPEFSLIDPIDAVAIYCEGVRVGVPSPGRYAIQEPIAASARTGTRRTKVENDLARATALIDALGEARPYERSAGLADARRRGPKWRAAIAASLARGENVDRTLDRV